MKKVINLTIYNIGQAKGFILVVALLQILLQLGLKVKTLATTGLLTGQLRIVSPDIVKQVVLDQLSIGLPVFFAGTAILVYSAVIWSREWSSKGSFIYRLLMLPGSRFGIYWAKLLTMLVITFFLQAVQVVGVFLNYYLTSFFIPEFAQYHITPWSLGGTNTLDNGRTICRRCNQKRGNGRNNTPKRRRTGTTTTLVAW